jgi:hypothetical protein
MSEIFDNTHKIMFHTEHLGIIIHNVNLKGRGDLGELVIGGSTVLKFVLKKSLVGR